MTGPIQQDLDVANMVRSDLYPNYHRHVTGYRDRIIQTQAIRIATLEEENKRLKEATHG